MIATDPYRLYATFCPNYYQVVTSQAKSELNSLLSNMSELARYKRGVLAFVYDGSGATLHALIVSGAEWNQMLNADFRAVGKGYLLIVGENNIISSYWSSGWGINWSNDTTTDRVDYTDMPIGDTTGDARPELNVGRVVGDTPVEMANTIRRSIQVFLNIPGHSYDRSHALSVSGTGDGVDTMVSAANSTATALTGKGYSVATLHWQNVAAGQEATAFANLAANRDAVYIFAHGNANSVGGLDTQIGMPLVNFGSAHPVVLAASCLTGDYVNGDIAGAFFRQGAGVYIGSTQLSPMSINGQCGKDLFNTAAATGTAGEQLTLLKRNYWGQDKWHRFWAAEYNFYGDPKFGGAGGVLESAAALLPAEAPTSIDIVLPPYVVTRVEGLDYVEIPGGNVWMEPGSYEIPYFTQGFDLPPGIEVQDVALLEKSQASEAGGLQLPIAVMDITGAQTARDNAAGAGSLPFAGQDFSWSVLDNPDGGSTLVIHVYPFKYEPGAMLARYCQAFHLAVAYSDSPLSVTRLQTDQRVYRLGASVRIDLEIANSGPGRDVAVSATIRNAGSGAAVQGLALDTLTGLAGNASLSLLWESQGFAVGEYEVEVVLSQPTGIVLERRTTSFSLGMTSGEIGGFAKRHIHLAEGLWPSSAPGARL